jgi:cation diffusion facilitator family transporter
MARLVEAVASAGPCSVTGGSKSNCLRCGRRAGWVGVWVNVAMVILKVTVGITAGSRACLADALHSGTNIVTAFAIFLCRKWIGKPVDEGHPYGHGKVEFLAAAAVSAVIIVLTIFLVITSLEHVLYKPVPPPHLTAMLIALVSIATNEMLFRYFRCVGTELRSQTIIANAWANRADCFSSSAVVVGVVGAQLGFHHLDPISALVVACIIVKVSVGCIRESIAGMMDRNVSIEILARLRKGVKQVPEVSRIRQLRARLLGDKIWVDMAVVVSQERSVYECEAIADRIRHTLRRDLEEVDQVLVDFESEE